MNNRLPHIQTCLDALYQRPRQFVGDRLPRPVQLYVMTISDRRSVFSPYVFVHNALDSGAALFVAVVPRTDYY